MTIALNYETAFLKRYKQVVLRLKAWSLSSDDVEKALIYANLYGVVRSLNNDGIYADEELEQQLTKKVLAEKQIDIQSISAGRGDGVLLLATELYDFGGHTKVLMTWLKLMKDVLPHRLVITRALTYHVEKQVKEMGVDVVKIANGGVLEIIAAAKDFNRIVLHTHPEDIISAIAVRILADAGYEIIFYNHADHLFSFGISTAHIVCELSSYGEAINQRTGRVKGRAFRLGIPLKGIPETLQPFSKSISSNDRHKIILTVGNSYKYKPDKSFLFADFIDEILLRRSDVNVVIVGATGRESWWLSRRMKWGKRVLFMGVLHHSEYIDLLEVVDVYVDSYPVTGGTAFPEALLAGKSCIGLQTPMQGYSLADALKVSSVDELVHCAELILDRQQEIMLHQKTIREQVSNVQSESVFSARILDIYKHQIMWDDKTKNIDHVEIDSHFLEKHWRTRMICNIPKKILLSQLPGYRSFQLLGLVLWSNFLAKIIRIVHEK